MKSSTARVPTESSAKYVSQVCKHFSHRLEVRLGDGEGEIAFPEARALLASEPDVLVITVEAGDAETVERIQGVVERHLDRFAFREVPLQYGWSVIA
ncbi:MAG: DUF2218 domain-containing protein [Sphingomonas sp.]